MLPCHIQAPGLICAHRFPKTLEASLVLYGAAILVVGVIAIVNDEGKSQPG